MLTINIFLSNGEVIHWQLNGVRPNLEDLYKFIKIQYPNFSSLEFLEIP